ncbi:uncharacterized protein [Anoplolepis gracilipes]|uniref:uncharacterized protein n=1 Tax=Anoplolepis gracilipes TaxID=354296 RepID=UPI003B9F26EE
MTIPRLELSGAVLLTNLVFRVLHILKFKHVHVSLWTDSAVVFTWIYNHPSRWKDFVYNRVCNIHETLPQAVWRFVPVDNPADCAIRGLTSNQLFNHTIWWAGPPWLSQHISTWPQEPQSVHQKENLEERSSQVHVINTETIKPWNLIDKYSSFTRLLRITALCMRAIDLFCRSRKFTPPLTTQELETARIYWSKSIQESSFAQEMKSLSRLVAIRNKYWIVGGRTPVRSFILKCVRCARYRQKRAQQIIGQLPPERVTPSRPFLNSGIDYAGPFNLKNWKGRNSRTYKAYIALFVCLSTSAVHVELVTDYSTDAFIAAYKRFTSRRGICSTLTNDCGTNLKGADSQLKGLFSSSLKKMEGPASLLANDGTQWKFIPPAAPRFGGKWEAGVKSVKHHIRRVIGDQLLTYEEMSTFLTHVEAVLNSRLLSPLIDDPDDLQALTPAHFLIGGSLSTISEPSLKSEKISHLSRWQLTRQMLESFWAHWSKECLQRHLAIYKWNKETPPLQEGSFVLVVDERYPPSKWPLGRVTHTHPGKDGKVRVVTIRTHTSTFKRPITKLCPLPIPFSCV